MKRILIQEKDVDYSHGKYEIVDSTVKYLQITLEYRQIYEDLLVTIRT